MIADLFDAYLVLEIGTYKPSSVILRINKIPESLWWVTILLSQNVRHTKRSTNASKANYCYGEERSVTKKNLSSSFSLSIIHHYHHHILTKTVNFFLSHCWRRRHSPLSFCPTTSFFFFIFFEYLKTLNTEKPWFFHSAQQMPLETRVTKTVVCLVGLTKVAYIIVYDQ